MTSELISEQQLEAQRLSEAATHPTFDFYTEEEELTNTLTHATGLIFSGVGFFYFVIAPAQLSHRLIFGIYGLGVLLSYLTSTLYHGAPHGWQKHRLRLMDHAAIYVNIAGSYTPYLALLGTSWLSPLMLVVVWSIALAGAGFKLLVPDVDRFESYAVLSYLAIGWLFPLFIIDVYPNLPPNSLPLVFLGGLLYTIGILFYRWESIPHNHAIWHGFVMAAALCHYLAAFRLYLAIG